MTITPEQVDAYISRTLAIDDAHTLAALEAARAADLPEIQVSPTQGRLLELLARMVGAKRILEVGTLGGYSTIHLARGLAPTGRVISCEIDPKHAEVARTNIENAGLADRVEIRVGDAHDTLAELTSDSTNTHAFDLIFIDAEKDNIPAYLEAALKLCRRNGCILIDNTVRGGKIADPSNNEPAVVACRQLHELLGSNPKLRATTTQTIGHKGYDGLTMIVPTE